MNIEQITKIFSDLADHYEKIYPTVDDTPREDAIAILKELGKANAEYSKTIFDAQFDKDIDGDELFEAYERCAGVYTNIKSDFVITKEELA